MITCEVVNKWNDMDFGGSGIVGEINITKSKLVELLGEPQTLRGSRIDYRWLLKFDNGVIAVISKDKKDGKGIHCIGGFGSKTGIENPSLVAVKELISE